MMFNSSFTGPDLQGYVSFGKPDPDPHQSQNSLARDAKKWSNVGPWTFNGGSEAQNGVLKGLYTSGRIYVQCTLRRIS